MTDRLIAGALTAIALCVTAIVLALLLSLYRGGVGPDGIATLWSSLPAFLSFFGGIGFIVGALLGPEHTVTLLSHFWATAKPRRPLLTAALWGVIAMLWLAIDSVMSHGQL